jgi:hypothetical protein
MTDGRFQLNPQPSVPAVSTGVSKIALANPCLQIAVTGRQEPAELAPELRWHLDRFAEPGEHCLVFVGQKGAALRRSNFRPAWNAACAKAGLPDLHFHDLRHVRGTLAATTGASLKELMARLGHSSSAPRSSTSMRPGTGTRRSLWPWVTLSDRFARRSPERRRTSLTKA